jgi:hypothetical protein
MKLVSVSDITGAIYLVCTMFVTLAFMHLICCLKGQKEFVRIHSVLFFFFTNKTFSAYFRFFYAFAKYGRGAKMTVPRGPRESLSGAAATNITFIRNTTLTTTTTTASTATTHHDHCGAVVVVGVNNTAFLHDLTSRPGFITASYVKTVCFLTCSFL